MIERYAVLRYSTDIAVLVVSGVICLIVILCKTWKRK